jgi:CRISPR-associated protein, Cas6-related
VRERSEVIDLVFPVVGTHLPADHGYSLYSAVNRVFERDGSTWFHDSEGIALLPVNGKYRPDHTLLLGRGSHFIIRVSASMVPDVLTLAGQRLQIGGMPLTIGAPQVERLKPSVALEARIVTTRNGDDPERFDVEIRRQLDELGISADAQRGRRRIVTIRGKKVVGHELVVAHLTAEESLTLQERGVGGRRKMGCGIFVPYRT